MKVHDVMHRDSECVGPNDSLGVAAELMKRFKVRAVPVLDHAKPLGVVTEADVQQSATEAQRDPLLLRVRGAMVECTAFVLDDDELDVAVQTMRANDAEEIPVLDQNLRLVGMLVRESIPGSA